MRDLQLLHRALWRSPLLLLTREDLPGKHRPIVPIGIQQRGDVVVLLLGDAL